MLDALFNASAIAPRLSSVIDEVEKVIVGKRDIVELCMIGFLSGGHVLIEDIPGVGKTTLGKAFSKALGCAFKRIQFTPDLLPADITGSSVFNQKTVQFEFHPGPVFANILLADEINRATPKTQSALLEAMEEQQVTSGGTTYPLPAPFFVIATENNIETHGTYPLPEAQLDRFLLKTSMGYPDNAYEVKMLEMQTHVHPLDDIDACLSTDEIKDLQKFSRNVYVQDSLRQYIVDLVNATRHHADVKLGASPRGSLALLHCSQARAAIVGRTYVQPDDILFVLEPVLSHRIIIRPEVRVKGVSASNILSDIRRSIPAPLVS
jgi:MoxR-like ATPase